MVSKIIHNETFIQIKLLEFIEREFQSKCHYAALEARYSNNERRADVVVVSDNKFTHAYEIKSEVDVLGRLPDQLKDYRRTFDYISVVTTLKHYRKVKKILGKNDGLIILSDNVLVENKAPVLNRKLHKKDLMAMCSKRLLAQELNLIESKYKLENIYNMAEKALLVQDLKRIFLKEFQLRFKNKYEEFCKEARFPYREEDLYPLKNKGQLVIDFI